MVEERGATSPKPVLSALFEDCLRRNGSWPQLASKPGAAEDDTDFGAVMYIIAVLVFYSAGIVIMIIKYLRTERKEMEEEATLDNFFKDFPDHRRAQEHHVNSVAIRAFHTLTSVVNEEEGLDDGDFDGYETEIEEGGKEEEGAGIGIRDGVRNGVGVGDGVRMGSGSGKAVRAGRGSRATNKRATIRQQPPPRRLLITDV